MIRKGAMFGLDARIALAIFGALSVISGAALYSAIKESKITAAVSQINEISKALIAFNLDTGSDLPQYNSTVRDASELVKSTADGSKGPYLPYKDSGNGFTFELMFLGSNSFVHIYDCADGFGDQASSVHCETCVSGKNCAPWMKLGDMSTDKLTSIDEKIDGGDGFSSGKVRVQWADAGKTDARLFVRLTERNLSQL